MNENNNKSFWIHETNTCDNKNIVYCIEYWFMNVNFAFFLLLFINPSHFKSHKFFFVIYNLVLKLQTVAYDIEFN